MKIKVFVVSVLAGSVLLTGCSNPPPPNYNDTWRVHYVNDRYDPYYDYGLGFYMRDGRRHYNVPKQAPPVVINNYNNSGPKQTTQAPKPSQAKPTTKPSDTPKPSAKPSTKPVDPPKAKIKVETPRPAPKPAPKATTK